MTLLALWSSWGNTLVFEVRLSQVGNDGSFQGHSIVMCMGDCRHGFGLANRFIRYAQVITAISSCTIKITVIITHE
jgi:hypothetical protein